MKFLGQKGVTISKLRNIWANIPQYEPSIDEQVEIDAHYMGYLKRQSHDIEAFKKDEAITIPKNINYDTFSGLSTEIKSKVEKSPTCHIRPSFEDRWCYTSCSNYCF